MVSRCLPRQRCFYRDAWRIRTHNPCVMREDAQPLHHGTTGVSLETLDAIGNVFGNESLISCRCLLHRWKSNLLHRLYGVSVYNRKHFLNLKRTISKCIIHQDGQWSASVVRSCERQSRPASNCPVPLPIALITS